MILDYFLWGRKREKTNNNNCNLCPFFPCFVRTFVNGNFINLLVKCNSVTRLFFSFIKFASVVFKNGRNLCKVYPRCTICNAVIIIAYTWQPLILFIHWKPCLYTTEPKYPPFFPSTSFVYLMHKNSRIIAY